MMPESFLLHHTKPTGQSLQSMFPGVHKREKDLFLRIMVEKEAPMRGSLFCLGVNKKRDLRLVIR